MKTEDLYTLEHSQWSADHKKFPWHVGRLGNACTANLSDCLFNNRGMNKWQIVGVFETLEECVEAMIFLDDTTAKGQNWVRKMYKHRGKPVLVP